CQPSGGVGRRREMLYSFRVKGEPGPVHLWNAGSQTATGHLPERPGFALLGVAFLLIVHPGSHCVLSHCRCQEAPRLSKSNCAVLSCCAVLCCCVGCCLGVCLALMVDSRRQQRLSWGGSSPRRGAARSRRGVMRRWHLRLWCTPQARRRGVVRIPP